MVCEGTQNWAKKKTPIFNPRVQSAKKKKGGGQPRKHPLAQIGREGSVQDKWLKTGLQNQNDVVKDS